MNESDIVYVTSAIENGRSIPETLKTIQEVNEINHIAAIKGGFFSSQEKQIQEQKLRQAQQLHCARMKPFEKQRREALDEVQKQLDLTKGAKVRQSKLAQRFNERSRRFVPQGGKVYEVSKGALRAMANDPLENTHAKPLQSGWVTSPDNGKFDYVPKGRSRAYLMHRGWANQYKMQIVYHPTPTDAPDVNTGERFTEKLTNRAVKKIFESGAYVAACHGGFTTFLTLTFDAEKRAKILGDNEGNAATSTIGAEVSRFLDGAKKMYQRGFEYTTGENDGAQNNIEEAQTVIKVEGIKNDFHYVWVAECPENKDGDPNPHVHLLLNWQVEPQHFKAWAKRIENLWGQGFAHLERIKYKEAASGYLIKAVGYAAKGKNANQGLIRGNRYNIARCSRAPDWDVLASFEVDNMTSIIKECGYKLERWRKPIVKELARKQAKRDEAIKAQKIYKKKPSRVMAIQKLIKKLESEILEQRELLKSRGVYASSEQKFSITFEGEQAKSKMDTFLIWAAGARDWTMNTDDADLDDLKRDAVTQYQAHFEKWQDKQAYWRALLNDNSVIIPAYDAENVLKELHWRDYQEYSQGLTMNH